MMNPAKNLAALLVLLPVLFAPALPAQVPATAGGFDWVALVDPVSGGRALAFSPDGRLFYSEAGTRTIKFIEDPTTTPGAPQTLITLTEAEIPAGNDASVHGIAFHPNFPASTVDPNNRFIYVVYTVRPGGTGPFQYVVREIEEVAGVGTLSSGSIVPAFTHSTNGQNFGGRIVTAPDGTLMMGSGDGGDQAAIAGLLAQNVNDRRGKILRYQTNGNIPLNNPLTGNPMYALGLSNPRGIAYNPSTQELFCVDRGLPDSPGSGTPDELNVITAAGNYGWDASGTSGTQTNAAYSNPGFEFPPTFDAGGICFFPSGIGTATGFPTDGYRNGVVYVARERTTGSIAFPYFPTQTGGMVVRVILTGGLERNGVAMMPIVTNLSSAVRDIKFGPDGNLYVLTDTVLYRIFYDPVGGNNQPIAHAGIAQTQNEGALVTLTAAASSDPDLDSLTYIWRQIGGSTVVTLTNAASISPTFTAPQVTFTQNYTFEVLVDDGRGGVDAAVVQITVNDVSNPGTSKKITFEAQGEGGCSTDDSPASTLALIMAIAMAALAITRRNKTRA